MKRSVVAIFAHPDDETVAAGGMLIKAAQQGADVHLITFTMGEHGHNPDNTPNLAKVREREWRDAAKIIGVKRQVHLGYTDGQLCNADIDDIVSRIVKYIEDIATEDAPTTIDLVSFDTDGYTGHIDHIVAAHAAKLVFARLKLPAINKLMAARATTKFSPTVDTSWRYQEAGIEPNHPRCEVVDARAYTDILYRTVRAYASQRADGEKYLQTHGEDVGLNYFFVTTR